jgi:hypothetical protein
MVSPSVSRSSVEIEKQFKRGPLFQLDEETTGWRPGGPLIVRTDPDEDGVALVDRIRKEFPRESELVSLDENQELQSIDLRPYFCEDDIHRQGSSMLRWILLRISSLNSRRMHQIRRMGWEWKEANPGIFWNALEFSANLLLEHGMVEAEDGQLLEPVASLLNNLRSFFHKEGIFNAEQGEYSPGSWMNKVN